jgi:hypothetical protein
MTEIRELKNRLALLEEENKYLKDDLDNNKTKKPLLKTWAARSKEDRLLERYYKKRPGMFIVEVPIGGSGTDLPWGDACTTRRLDAVRISGSRSGKAVYKHSFHKDGLSELFKGKNVEVIEIKQKLNRPVIGQVIAGRDMIQEQYDIKSAKMVIVCSKGDFALEWVCKKQEIKVVVLDQL